MKKLFTCILVAVFIAAALFLLPAPFVSAEQSESEPQSILVNGIKELFDR